MGYRNETEHLRHRVAQLEGELTALKDARGGVDESTQVAKGRRQTILLIVLASLASASTGLCLVPTIAASFGEQELESLDDVSHARRYTMHTFRGTISPDGHIGNGYNPAAALVEDPRVIVRCTWGCNRTPRLREELLLGGTGGLRTFNGEVAEPGDYAFTEVGLDLLEAHAERHGLTLDQLRIVTLNDRDESPLAGLFLMVGTLALSSLGLWIAVFWHRRALLVEAPLPIASDYSLNDAGTTLMLTIVTCRLYELFWIYRSTAQLRRLTGRRDLIPALDVMLTIATFGLWGYWVFYRNVEAVDEALNEFGRSPQVGSVVGLTFGSFLCGILHWVLIYKVQESYNMLAIEKMGVDDF